MSIRRVLLALGAVAVAAVSVLTLTAGPAAALPAFGTAPVSGGGPGPLWISDVTVGHHEGWDRVVLRASRPIDHWEVRYVTQVTRDGSGEPVPLLGAADIQVVLRSTDWTNHPSVQPNIKPGFPALRQVAGAGEFEAVAAYGIGQQRKAGFRAFTLTGPDRLVIDVAA